MRLQDKVVLVTASTRGIGLSCVEACAKEGAIVYMGARNLERAKEIADGLNEKGYRVKYAYSDATKEETFVSMVEEVVKNEGRIDVLVNNFGTSDPRKDLDIAHTDPSVFIDTVSINLKSVFITSQAAIKHMETTGGGSIINISSIGGLVPDISQIGYGTSKGAINYLTKLIAVQEARHNIRCNAVLPGMTATDAVKDNLTEDFKNFFLRHTPIKRMGLPEEIAGAVVYFASDDAAYTTGQIMAVAGGFGLATPIFGDLADRANARG
ncbi:MAG: SDR family oxidoreductase [Eubacteriales bacterium]|nr:SDR family oxidoreductase [Eubacteriales bacterium]